PGCATCCWPAPDRPHSNSSTCLSGKLSMSILARSADGSSHVGFFPHQAADLSQRSCKRARHASRGPGINPLAASGGPQRKRERDDVVEQPKQQQTCEQVFFVELPKRNHHRGVEDTKAAGSVAGKTQKRRSNKDDRHRDEAEMRLVRNEHVHGGGAKPEI